MALLHCLPEDLYFHTILYLDNQDLSKLSLTSKNNYVTIFKLASEAKLVCYHKIPPLILLEFTALIHPFPHLFVQDPPDELLLLQRRFKNITFNSDPRNRRFAGILNRAFQKTKELESRQYYLASSQESQIRLGKDYQEWMQENVFAGPTGLRAYILLGHISNLSKKHHELQVIKKTLPIFPEGAAPRRLKVDSLNFTSFRRAVSEELYFDEIAHSMKIVHDFISYSFNFSTDSAVIQSFIRSIRNDQLAAQYLLEASDQIFANQFDLSELESTPIRAILRKALSTESPLLGDVDFDMPDYIASLKQSRTILERRVKKHDLILKKHSQHISIFWRAIFLEDRETLKYIIQSHAFFYLEWGRVLKIILDKEKFDLFLYLISFPQILDVLSSDQFQEIANIFIRKQKNALSQNDPSDLLPFLNYQEIVPVWGNFNYFNDIQRYFLPFLLGHHAISPTQWGHLYSLMVKRHPSTKVFGIILNALVREGRADIIRMILKNPNSCEDIPSTSAPNPLIPFLKRYPLLWNRLCSHPEKGAQLFAKTIYINNGLYLFHVLGPEKCIEILQFFITHSEMVELIANQNLLCMNRILNDFKAYCSLEILTNEDSIQNALEECVPDIIKHSESTRPAINNLALILFAHDRYFLKFFVELTQRRINASSAFKMIIEIVQDGASLLITLSKPSENPNLPKPPPYKTLDILLWMEYFDRSSQETLPNIGWDTIFSNASPPLLEVLASFPRVALEMPKELRKKYLPQDLKLQEANFQAFLDPQEDSITTVAEQIGALLQLDSSLDRRAWKVIATKCSFFRRVALAFKLPQLLSPERYRAFYQKLPLFYRLIGKFSYFSLKFCVR